jgi:alpha-N-arabinofuranosidase
MPSYPDWERIVLEHTYEHVDYISLHMYFANRDDNTPNYLGLSEKLDTYIETVASTIRQVKAKKKSKKDVFISFDEWNVWYHSNKKDREILDGNSGWPHAPGLLEDIYNFEDVLMVGLILNTFIRRADVVKVACIAQLVNVIAPIMTERGGPAWAQTIYYPYYFASVYGRGTALQLKTSSPAYETTHAKETAYVDVSGVHNEAEGTLTFFLVNRHPSEAIDTSVSLQGFGSGQVIDHQVMTHADLKAVNTAGKQDEVKPRQGSGASLADGTLSVSLPPYSYQMIRVKL